MPLANSAVVAMIDEALTVTVKPVPVPVMFAVATTPDGKVKYEPTFAVEILSESTLPVPSVVTDAFALNPVVVPVVIVPL